MLTVRVHKVFSIPMLSLLVYQLKNVSIVIVCTQTSNTNSANKSCCMQYDNCNMIIESCQLQLCQVVNFYVDTKVVFSSIMYTKDSIKVFICNLCIQKPSQC